jgi:predicted DNA-binding protein
VKKFKIPSIPPTTPKTVRFPNDVIERIERAIKGTGCTFSAFVVEAVKDALQSVEQDEDGKE